MILVKKLSRKNQHTALVENNNEKSFQVNTKADVRFNVDSATWLPEEVRKKLKLQQAKKINKNGDLVVASTKTRSQEKNVQDAISRIMEMCQQAAQLPSEPSPEQQALVHRLQRKANERRIQDKKMRSSKKADRRSKGGDF
eukprot:m.78088 g.78088  ORF g.78088 m.78088 type:complete len:141 (-) comp20722_c0_seq1:25-447(-)